MDRSVDSIALESFAPELALLVWVACGTGAAESGAAEGGAEAAEAGGAVAADDRAAALVTAVTDWDLFVRLAARHGMVPLVARSVRAHPEAWSELPEEVAERLAGAARGNVIRCLRLGGELIRVLRTCADAGVEVMPLKGPVLAQEAYGDLALRQISDLDVLVRPEQVVRAVEVVMEAGYVPLATMGSGEVRYSLRSGQDIVFRRRASRAGAGASADAEAAEAGPGTILELHWRLTRDRDGLHLAAEEVFARARRVDFLKDQVLFPEWADLLVYLAVHASNHGWEQLEQLACLAEIVRQRPQSDQAALLRVAEERGALRRMRVAVLLTGDFLGVPWEPGVLAGVRADRGAARVAAAAARAWLQGVDDERTGTTRSHGRFGPALLRMTSQDGPAAQARYAALLALEPDELDWAVVDLPTHLEPLYYLVRPYRLARLYGGRAIATSGRAITAATRPVRRGAPG